MALEAPRLDDRSFNDLVEEALRRIPLYCPEWTDHNLSDPGITLIELFAWMTDITIYRLNRVPDKHYIKFMELIGIRMRDAEPARVPITFWLSAPQKATITVPANTAVATTRTETETAITFTTDVAVDVYPPKMTYAMTSVGGANQRRRFTMRDLAQIDSGFEEFSVFESSTPQPDDALYLGFDQDLSYHLLGVEIEVSTAEGAGIDPTNPPYVWEVLQGEQDQEWARAEVDYDGTLGFNVTGVVRLHLPAMQRGARNNYNAFWVRCRLMNPDEGGGPSYQVSPKIRKIKTSAWGVTIAATNVTTVRNEIVGRSDGSPGQRFYLEHTPVMPRKPGEHLVVRYDDGREERWSEVSDFSSSTPDDRHYTIDSRSGEIRLPPALPQRDGSVRRYGSIVPKNAMVVMRGYRYGGGRAGNVASDTLKVLKTALPYVARVTNRQPAQGGLDAEHLDDTKMRVPSHLRSLGRAVTGSDFEYLAREAALGQVGRAYCLQSAEVAPGEVHVLIIPQVPNMQGFIAPESLRLLPDVHERVVSYLDERRLLSTRLVVSEPQYVWVQTEVRFRPSYTADTDQVRRAIEMRLFEFLNPLTGGTDGNGWTFGRGLFVADIMAVLLAIPGVDFIRSVKLYPVVYDSGEFMRGNEAQEIEVPANGVVVSVEHLVRAE